MILKQDFKQLFFILLVIFSAHIPIEPVHASKPFVFAELLYWQPREGGDENWAQYITPKGAEQSITLYDAPFKFNPGFRVGIGSDLVLYYTYYQTNAENHASGDIYSAYLGNYFANNTNGANFGPFYDSANMRWDFTFQSIDLELGRKFPIDKILILRPFVGLKTAFINQKIDTNWYGPKTTDIFGIIIPITTFSTATENLKQDFFGIGPSLGLDTTWPLYQSTNHNFNLIGNLSAALLWGHWSFSDQYENNTPVSITVDTDSFNGAETVVRGILGFEWSNKFSQHDLTIRLNYEAQLWMNQIQFYTLSTGRMNNLMSIQGANLGFNLSFRHE